jgi:bifunctional UDP-N-acetylglucosamine pyrophosphorylase/glucosamine-1-phosphate N-acetyltransferase
MRRDVSIDVNCVFEGQVSIGEGATIGAHCVIRNARIGAGVPSSPSPTSRTRWSATAPRSAPMRACARVPNWRDVHIGNFVEVKNSIVGVGSKANHLAYVGDADVGSGVNVGAGTITCNYDGANKFRTVIEDDAFIGSDSQLVAPVRVGKGATIGAGTTLTKDAPADQLTLSRRSSCRWRDGSGRSRSRSERCGWRALWINQPGGRGSRAI